VIVWKRCVPALLVMLGSLLAPQSLVTKSQGQTPAPPSEPGRLGVQAAPVIPPGASPAPGVSHNQNIANAIAEQVRHSGQLRHYQVNVVYQNGVAELTGQVADGAQRDEVLRLVQAVPGVERVRDNLVVANRPTVQLVQQEDAKQEDAKQEDPKLETAPPPGVAQPPLLGGAGAAPNGLPEPTPIFQGMPGALPNPALQPPRMPPYAWPTYAPYNNYSRVAYPTQYPYEAWPFIGPFYPFPKVPLGWRNIQLTWRDGYWWYGKYATGYDWWRIRYR